MLFALFFFFRDGDAIMSRLRRVLPFDPSFREGRIRETAELIKASISSGIIVALVQGAVGGITFALLGLGAPVFWGVIMAFFSLLPLGRMDRVAARCGLAAADRRDRRAASR